MASVRLTTGMRTFISGACVQAFTRAIPHNERVLLDGHVLAEWGFDLIQQTHQLVDVMESGGDG
jgi:hypothetical protein